MTVEEDEGEYEEGVMSLLIDGFVEAVEEAVEEIVEEV
jgi:hypothetical protein